jgi:hypothetical protein
MTKKYNDVVVTDSSCRNAGYVIYKNFEFLNLVKKKQFYRETGTHTPADKNCIIKKIPILGQNILPKNSKLVTATSTNGMVRSSLASSGQLARKQTNKNVKTLIKCPVLYPK